MECRDYMNQIQEEVYFVLIYIFGFSFQMFWHKTFFEEDDIIIGYIPKLYHKKHLEIYHELIKYNIPKFCSDLERIAANMSQINDNKKEMLVFPKLNKDKDQTLFIKTETIKIEIHSSKMKTEKEEKNFEKNIDKIIQEKQEILFDLIGFDEKNIKNVPDKKSEENIE